MMIQEPTNQAISMFPLFIGSLAILLALFGKRLSRAAGLKPLSEGFTNPRFQRSAKMTERLGRLFLIVFGVVFLVQGIGSQFFSAEVTGTISTIFVGLSVLIVLVIVGVTIANWKA